jgi:membrane-associated PAP2 superfamily phosphatase
VPGATTAGMLNRPLNPAGTAAPATPAGAAPASAERIDLRAAHLLLPGLLLALGTTVLMFGGGDLWWARQLYALEGGGWTLRHDLLAEGLLHRGGRLLSALAWLGLLGAWLWSRRRGWTASRRRTLAYLLLCVASSTVLVTGLKRLIVHDCAWSVEGLGGDRHYLSPIDPRPLDYPVDHCFPAAHASAGYAWLALYFAGFASPRWRRAGLAVGLGAGLLFGLAQQLRGAHFASHDLWSAALCWTMALLWLPLLRRGHP